MFGYVKAYKPELKMSEYDTYKAVYCSLCRQLEKDYGVFASSILSYDFTFLALLRMSIQTGCSGYEKKRCRYNPTKKCMYLCGQNEQLSYTAACGITLFYYKLLDNLADNGFFSRIKYYLIYPLFSHYRKKATKKYPEVDELCREMMNEQNMVEKSLVSSIDAAAEPTAKLLSKMFCRQDDSDADKRIFTQLGYLIGKWIYISDAADDLCDDLKSGTFNALINKYNLVPDDAEKILSARQDAISMLNVCNSQATAAFELLESKRYSSIIKNVLYLGMPETAKKLGVKKHVAKDKDKNIAAE